MRIIWLCARLYDGLQADEQLAGPPRPSITSATEPGPKLKSVLNTSNDRFWPEANLPIVASCSFRLRPESLVVTFSEFLGPSVPKVALGQNQKSCDLLNVVDLIRSETLGL